MHRNRWMIAAILTVVVVVGLVNVAGAARKAKGQDAFKELCKPCHMAGSDNGEYTPMTLIQDQWNRFFDEKYVPSHESVLDPNHDNKPVTEVIDAKTLEEIRDFAVDHAADSEHPMTCG